MILILVIRLCLAVIVALVKKTRPAAESIGSSARTIVGGGVRVGEAKATDASIAVAMAVANARAMAIQ